MYIHQLPNWPNFVWDSSAIAARQADVRYRQGRLAGRMEAIGFPMRVQAELTTLTEDVIKTSAIEGEILDRDQVRSSIARRLGLDIAGSVPSDRNVDGVVDMMIDATHNFDRPLTRERLFAWHASLFPGGFSGSNRIRTGAWRTAASGPMQVVSGPIGRERIHFEAPDAKKVPGEMRRFLTWFEADSNADPVVKAALAHLRFLTIHPFEDGNGRIARAIGDMALARSERSPHRFYSMSGRIRAERNDYYAILERTQKGALDVTDWLIWFLDCMGRAITEADTMLSHVLKIARFWDDHRTEAFDERQRKLLQLLLEGFEGNLTTSKWARIAKCSQDTAYRDILDLVERGLLTKSPAGGRSTRYELVDDSLGSPQGGLPHEK